MTCVRVTGQTHESGHPFATSKSGLAWPTIPRLGPLDPPLDWEPVTWTEAERKMGQAWGLETLETFQTHDPPPVEGS